MFAVELRCKDFFEICSRIPGLKPTWIQIYFPGGMEPRDLSVESSVCRDSLSQRIFAHEIRRMYDLA